MGLTEDKQVSGEMQNGWWWLCYWFLGINNSEVRYMASTGQGSMFNSSCHRVSFAGDLSHYLGQLINLEREDRL